jgi:UDP-GlcNAc:undecaprenyl-phosphate/decaprenyl-phosphate GlcNAc-1-phosphate transferase
VALAPHAAAFLVSFLTAVAVTPLVRHLAKRSRLFAIPVTDRWHKRPVPLFGGVAMALAFVAGLFGIITDSSLIPLLLCSGLMFLLGVIDDVHPIGPIAKLVCQMVITGIVLTVAPTVAITGWPVIDQLLAFVWIIGITNAFNLLDNMDGLCAGIALIAGMTLLAAIVLQSGMTPEATYLALLLGATAGFLVYNIHPASIFMGDSGSLFIGFNLAVLSLGPGQQTGGSPDILSIVAGPVLLLLVPIFDTTLVTVSRLLSGRSAAQGGRDHSSHRLVAIGLSERRAVAVLWSLAALGGLLALSIHRFDNDWSSIATAVFLLAMIIFAVYLSHVRVYEDVDESLLRAGRVTPFVVNFMYKRRIAEVVLDVCIVSIAYYSAYRLRFEGPEFSTYFRNFLESLPIMVGVQMIVLFAVGAYRGVWRHFSLIDSVVFSKAVLFGTLTSVFILVYLYRFENYSRGVFVIYAALLLLLLGGSRASFRLISEFAQRRRHEGRRLVIYGAGDGAATTVRELMTRSPQRYRLLGFVDDDPHMARRRVHGYPVLGDHAALVSLIANGAVDSVVISAALIDVNLLAQLQALCTEHQVSLARVHFKLDHLVAS